MKTLLLSSLAVFALAFNAPKAQAGDEALALIGGLIGGILIGTSIDNHHNDNHGRHHRSYRRSHHRGHHGGTSIVIQTNHRHKGHWKYITVRTWIPGHWDRSYDHCGNSRRNWVQGHYTQREKRIWVKAHYAHQNCACNNNDDHRGHYASRR
ncbi:MAG: hypothetical protein JKY51_01520 [Opitutaceae bacterium]|nr:hypothetical protein [Opitutaceae bacterium]